MRPGCREEFVSDSQPVRDLIEFFHDRISDLPRFERQFSVAIEPGCNAMGRKKEMRAVVEALGCKVLENRMGCCGRDRDVSAGLMAEREAECSGASIIVVACPRCLSNYDSYKGGVPVVHLSELVSMASGDFSTLRYHQIPIVMDEDFYRPRQVVQNLLEDKTRW